MTLGSSGGDSRSCCFSIPAQLPLAAVDGPLPALGNMRLAGEGLRREGGLCTRGVQRGLSEDRLYLCPPDSDVLGVRVEWDARPCARGR